MWLQSREESRHRKEVKEVKEVGHKGQESYQYLGGAHRVMLSYMQKQSLAVVNYVLAGNYHANGLW